MKILALHGLGSSSQLLREQLRPFIKQMGSSYQFKFLDGAVPCERGPGVPAWASGPFYSFATGFTPSEMRDALSKIEGFIRDHGPFDGVFGFSLGAAVAISYILDQQSKHALTPFGFGVFFSTIFIASPDDSYCEGIFRRWLADDHAEFRSRFPDGNFMPLLNDATDQKLAAYLQVVLSMQSMGVGEILPNVKGDLLAAAHPEGVPRLMHPDLLQARVKIPTVHVTGQKDSPYIRYQSRVGQGLCTSRMLRQHEHEGGHDLPFKRSDVDSIVRSINAMAEEAQDILDLNEL